MSFDEVGAKAVVAALLDAACARVGRFVPVTDVITSSGLDDTRGAAVLDELAIRRWVHIRDGFVAASKWAIEFGMDWTFVEVVLRAIQGSGKHWAEMDVVIAASGLPPQKMEELINELEILRFADHLLLARNGHPPVSGVSITLKGREYLNNGCKVPETPLWARTIEM